VDFSAQTMTTFGYALLLTESPMLVLAVVGAVLTWVKLARTYRAAFRWSLAAFAILGLRSVLVPFGRAQITAAVDAGVRPSDLANVIGQLTLASYGLLLLGIAFLLAAVLSNRAVGKA
jgi:hypothetical protein